MRSKLKVIMFTSLKLVSIAGKVDHLLFLIKDKSDLNSSFFSAGEKKFIESQLKEDKKQIIINQLNRFIYIQVLPKDLKNASAYLELLRKAGAKWTARFNASGHESVTLIDNGEATQILALAEGISLANYQFLKYKSSPGEKNTLKSILLSSKKLKKETVDRLNISIEATCIARNLVNEPASYLSASVLSEELSGMGKKAGYKTTVFNKQKIKQMKMGGLLAVNMGSKQPPTFTVMQWKPQKAVNKKPIILVGKGVVFDTGGLSLKPTANSMDYMKCDMGGGAAVGAAMYAVAKAKLPVHVIALVPATDNRPGEEAYLPGDVLKMMSGKTVEVLNTDAEGRLILADALHYAKQFNPELVMEFSTLTGSAAATLGHYGIVAMGNAGDDVFTAIKKSAENVYERFALLPFWEEFNELIKSDIADLKNIGGANAGAITAGKFLEHFTDYPFIHFDIAGPAFSKTHDSYRGKNGTGVGVRLLFDYFCTRAGIKN
jgi:leucyl aminopeptidase